MYSTVLYFFSEVKQSKIKTTAPTGFESSIEFFYTVDVCEFNVRPEVIIPYIIIIKKQVE
jgi:hypothetical protein